MKDLHAARLGVSRGDRRILSGLDFRVGAGEVLHLVGPNGAGKTSLLEVLCGLRRSSHGSLEGQPAADQLHWLGHRNALHEALSPLENLRFWCRLSGVSNADAGSALDRVGMRRLRHRPCGRLSTGQKRRTALARLVAVQRPWWFLDEPLAGLDAAGIALVCGLMTAQVKNGGAVVLSSHQPLPEQIPGFRQLVLSA